MYTEQEKTLEALQTAIQMEIDGKEFYLKASQESNNQLGKELLQTLATEEDYHRQKFKEIYDIIQSKQGWPKTDLKPDGGQRLRTIFAKAAVQISFEINYLPTELEAVQTALDMENKTHDFYKIRGEKATYNAERDFYETLAAEEKEHHLILLDYSEYLKDPTGWFVHKERPSLDGG